MSINRQVLLKLQDNNYIKNSYTHLVLDNVNNNELIEQLYTLKKENRKLKLIYILNLDKGIQYGTKNIIKMLINYCFDGVIFENISSVENIYYIYKLMNIMLKLPRPYNFKWDFYIKTNNFDIILDLFRLLKSNNHENIINGIITNYEYIKLLTDNGFNSSLFIINNTETDTEIIDKINKMGIIYLIKMNKLGGIYTDELYNLGSELISSNNGLKNNHINYPNSEIVKSASRKEINEILEFYF